MSDVIICKSPVGRLRWNNLFKAQVNEDSESDTPFFNAMVIFDTAAQADPLYAGMQDAVERFIKQKWGGDAPAKLKRPFREGSDKDLKKYPEFGNAATFINTKTKNKPGIVHGYLDPETGKPKELTDQGEIYQGIYVRVSLTLYDYKMKGNVGVAFGLRNLQKVRDGELLGPANNAADDFDAVDGSAGGDIFD